MNAYRINIRYVIIFTLVIGVMALNTIKAQLPAFPKEFPTFLYSGMDNPIPVVLNGADPELVNCKVSQAQRVTKYNDSLYGVYPGAIDDKATIKLYYRNIIVEQKHVEILPALQVRISFNSEGEGFVQRQALLKLEGFSLLSSQGEKTTNLNLRLISGGITIFNPVGQVVFSSNLRDSQFNQQLKDQFKSIPEGSRIAISNPRVVNQYNQSVQTEPYREWILTE